MAGTAVAQIHHFIHSQAFSCILLLNWCAASKRLHAVNRALALAAGEPLVLPDVNLVGAMASYASPLVENALAGPRYSWRSARSEWPCSGEFKSWWARRLHS
jgi:hypothetical protein